MARKPAAKVRTIQRRSDQIRRMLVEIDVLAPLRIGVRACELRPMLKERGIDTCTRTIMRDLAIFHSLGLLIREPVMVHRSTSFRYRLQLNETINLQRAAIQITTIGPQRELGKC